MLNPVDSYKVELDIFEGPLDLLLYLLRRDELDIHDIPIEKIAAQYMAYVDMMRMLDLNVAGEFVVMASTLMVIKSRMLLPADDAVDGEDAGEEELDPRWDLVRQLVEYKKFKDAAGRLMDRESVWLDVFGPGGASANEFSESDQGSLPLGDISLFDLLNAFQDVLRRAPDDTMGHIEPLRWSVPEAIEGIKRRLRQVSSMPFRQLFRARAARGEIIVTFLALLELLRQRNVAVHQEHPFAEIMIERVSVRAPEAVVDAIQEWVT